MRGALFDHLVGAGEEGFWDAQAQCLGGVEVDSHIKLARLLNGQIGGLLAAQYSVYVRRRLSEMVDVIRPVRNQTAVDGEIPLGVDRW